MRSAVLILVLAIAGCAAKHPPVPTADGLTNAGAAAKNVQDSHDEVRDVLLWFKKHAQESNP